MLNFVKKNVIVDNIFNLVCSFGAIVFTHSSCHRKSNLMLQPNSAHQEENFEVSYVIFRPKIKKLHDEKY